MGTHPPAFRFRALAWAVAACCALALLIPQTPLCSSDPCGKALRQLTHLDFGAMRLAVTDLMESFPDRYPDGARYLAEIDRLGKEHPGVIERLERGDAGAPDEAEAMLALQREALLSNPLLDFESLLLIDRNADRLGLPQNWESNSSLPRDGFDNRIAILSPPAPDGQLSTLYRPERDVFVGDVDLHFDADRLLFSSIGEDGRWGIFEMALDGGAVRELPLIEEPDIDNYDSCYLPDGNILFTSTAPIIGVPCVAGAAHVSNLYLWEITGNRIRRLTFEQDHDWNPTVLPNGRVLYLRWEYSDIPHFVSRILFHMNPDGTGQMEYYGSNSYWPNSMFYARPVPGDPTRFMTIVGGHHDEPRMGDLVLFDTSKGRRESEGVVQRIPGRGKPVEPVILDGLIRANWPKFLHPWPLSGKYALVSCKPSPEHEWGIYLADVFDNLTLIKEIPGRALLEPVPLRAVERPPVIPPKVDFDRKDALVYMVDVYRGGGLAGVPKGTVRKLRLFTYQFAYHGMGGQVHRVGLDGPWDVKRIIGTVPVEEDGSAFFRVPANTPISIQPLDGDGKALQLMRSWMTAMPGETLSCVGCHESQNTASPPLNTLAFNRAPSEIEPWHGPTRGFSFKREVQPVLDAHCAGCHDGTERFKGISLPDFTARPEVHPQSSMSYYNDGSKFSPSYLELRRFARSHTIESDIHMLAPGEFHADASELIQMLEAGHYGVKLGGEARDRLITWIDLNTPYHGTWREIVGDEKVLPLRDRRRELMIRYANIGEDPEAIGEPAVLPVQPVDMEAAENRLTEKTAISGWRIETGGAAAGASEWTLDLGGGAKIEMVRIPAGEFVKTVTRPDWERPRVERTVIEKPFWMSRHEISNEVYNRFDPAHDSRLEHGDFLQFSSLERGYPVNEPRQPVVRVSWNRAAEFCRWLPEKTGRAVSLPTAEQWEYACRAGTRTPLWFGDPARAADGFANFANLADHSYQFVDTFGWGLPSGAIPPWRPAAAAFNDGHRVGAPAGSYLANPWGLFDMHGNAAEWTASDWPGGDGVLKIVCGGSWSDRPANAAADQRRRHAKYLPVFDVGFRIVCEGDPQWLSAN